MADDKPQPTIGTFVTGIDTPVINERAVRASAGILFLLGFPAWLYGIMTGDLQYMRLFGVIFVMEMLLRLLVGTSFTPSLMLGTLITRRQRPEWVDTEPKQLAWSLGLGMGLAGCLSLGWLGLPGLVAQIICAVCLTLLYVESAFGICLGCALSRRLSQRSPQRCSGDTCSYTPPARGERHSVQSSNTSPHQ